MLRLFFALRPSPDWGARLLEEAAPLLAELGAAPVPLGNLHATLCFVGAVAPERLDDLRAAARGLRCAAVNLCFDAFEYWEKPRVLVAGASRESAPAAALSIALREAAVGAGFAPDQKDFRAHLTLARKISPTAAEKISWPRSFSPGFVDGMTMRAEKFALMESRRGEQGSIYSVVDEWPLYEKTEH